jgi:PAT family acetyl-CoA transporter-like MFS transporter 1
LPYILSARKISYADQGVFSFVWWPFSLKLLWAPIVDSLFIRTIGRRKSWLVPVQYIIGVYMIYFSSYIQEILENSKAGSQDTVSSDIKSLALVFLFLSIMSATQVWIRF